MSYFIFPDREVECEDYFPDGLSNFFEQVGGYDETAEVEQVSRELQIDLSAFQHLDSETEEGDLSEEHWQDIDTVTALVDTFIKKLEKAPQLHQQVYHIPDSLRQEQNKVWNMTYGEERDKAEESLTRQPFYYYPPATGYLREGRIVQDLTALQRILTCFKSKGVREIHFVYM